MANLANYYFQWGLNSTESPTYTTSANSDEWDYFDIYDKHRCIVHTYSNPTEQAYRIMKKLIEKEIVPEPESYKKFCEMLEAIKEVV
jgi:hypothetical protein